MQRIKIGLFYNLRQDFSMRKRYPVDVNGDWDTPDTIREIIRGLQNNHFEVLDFGDPKLLFRDDIRETIDIIFSTCEMQGYRFRESVVPFLCELLGLPYVFSPPDTMMISLDKNICNMLVHQSGGNVPVWHLVKSSREIGQHVLDSYPYIVKPSCEGSGMGITQDAVVYDRSQMVSQVEFVTEHYEQPALVQEFMSGREFTVGVIETEGRTIALEPLELKELDASKDFTYSYFAKENADQEVFFEPLKTEPELRYQICELAVRSFEAIGCRDAARVDIRLSNNKVPFFLEINPLPHLHPKFGDFCRSANSFGLTYDQLIGKIVNNAISRYDFDQEA